MKRLALLLAGSALLACSSDDPVQPIHPVPPPPPTVGFLVTGFVDEEGGARLAGATVELMRPGHDTLTTTTEGNGLFSFASIVGPATLRVWKPGYVGEIRLLNVTWHWTDFIRLNGVLRDAILPLDSTVASTVQAAAPPCDPAGWDGLAPCRRFLFVAPASGRLMVSIAWQGSPELDAALVFVRGGYVASYDQGGVGRFQLESSVVKGVEYELRVNSYYGTQAFELRADLTP